MKTRSDVAFAVVLAAYVLYLCAVIWSSSTVVDGQRFFALGDDAMISMRYARNLVEGRGLVWNAGERPVEGYTNPLWVLVMAGAHALVPSSKTSAAVEVLSALLLAANLFVVRRLARELGAGSVAAVGAAALTATYYPLNIWSMQGSELALLVPVIGIGIALGIRRVEDQRFSGLPYWIVGAGMLVRPDFAVVYLGLVAVLAAFDRERRSEHVKYGLGVFVAFAAAQTAFRLAYYGEWLPNTYYLKMTGYPVLWRMAWGIRGLAGFLWHWQWLVLPFALLGLWRQPRSGAIVASVVAAQFAYVAYIGPADNRFTSLVMPLVFALAAVGVDALLASRTAWVCATLLAVAASTLTPEALWLRRFPMSILDRDKAIADLTTPRARVAVAAAGTLYFLDRPGVDVLGKNDYTLARALVHPSFRSFGAGYVSGHMKWDYAYSIGTLAPDVVAELWRYPDEAAPFLTAYEPLRIGDHTIYLRRGSAQIRWDRLPSRQASAARP